MRNFTWKAINLFFRYGWEANVILRNYLLKENPLIYCHMLKFFSKFMGHPFNCVEIFKEKILSRKKYNFEDFTLKAF